MPDFVSTRCSRRHSGSIIRGGEGGPLGEASKVPGPREFTICTPAIGAHHTGKNVVWKTQAPCTCAFADVRSLGCQWARRAKGVATLLEQRARLQRWVEHLAVRCAGHFKRVCAGSAVTGSLSSLALLFLL